MESRGNYYTNCKTCFLVAIDLKIYFCNKQIKLERLYLYITVQISVMLVSNISELQSKFIFYMFQEKIF